ncbi:GntR family transcriptional regulator [Erwinia psidii]|uniref:GntR family transcriptional regulator n=1 Tax=Erwinia psidii TaxID=69224 RepID=A0A3N6SF15_9GAMM|nr:GntR family transcriptional regulator [Erwinia psidii]MCX8956713.1 GntR family transcriptional regulator [Erwinia psidii]MCX8960476.1 GntR family transcriptional regulator [Erwinia psidii]MCX8964341.1 GntR family transcriptional regulator [Erwinia psidii]RQM40040.1 GntR family transcriptional regulator [Erwinia psidii]
MSRAAPTKNQEVQRIVESLSRAIAQHRLKPGMRLVEAQIADVLKANRNHVQTALQRMVLQHIVTIEPNRGAMVARPEAGEAREIFIARRAVECAIISCITPESMTDFADELITHLHTEQSAVARADRREVLRELCQFHLLLAKISGNRVLSEILANLMVRSSLIVALYQRKDLTVCQCDEHGEIVAALKAGDQDRAQKAMTEHLERLEQQLDLRDIAPDNLSLRDALAGYTLQ